MLREGLLLAACLGGIGLAASPADDAEAASGKSSAERSADAVAKEAHDAFVAGQAAFRAGKFVAAIERFQRAYQLKPHPIIRFNLARCFEQLDEPRQALQSYRTYLLEVPDTVDREAVSRSITALERKLARKNVQQLMVLAQPRDAQISVDGKALGTPPAFTELGPGDHRLLIEREGLEPVSRSFVMSTQRSLELSFELQPPAPPPPEPPAATAPPLISPPMVADAQASPRPLRGRLWAPLIAVGVGAAAAVVGFVETSALEASLRLELRSSLEVTPRAQRLANQGQAFQVMAWAGVALTAAGLVTTALFYFLPGPRLAPTVSLAPGGGTVGLTGVFP